MEIKRETHYRYWISIEASIILGLVFLVAGLGKLPYQGKFLTLIPLGSFLIPLLPRLVAQWLPIIELALGLLLITGFAIKLMASLSAVLIMVFITNNGWLLSHGLGYEPCGCFGIWEKLLQGSLSTTDALYIDIGMLALVSIILCFYPGNFFTIRPWFFKGNKIGRDKGDT